MPSEDEKTTQNQIIYQKSHQRALTLVRYSRQFLKRTREELQQMDQRTRKLMTMHRGLYPRDPKTDYMCQEKEEEDSPALKIVSIHR